jgi:hypothetical protein
MVSAGFLGFRKRVRACVCSRALTGFREHVRVRARSRAGVFVFRRHLRACVCSRAGDFAGAKSCAAAGGGSDAVGMCRMPPSLSSVVSSFYCVIPGLDPGISCKVGLRSPGHGLATGPVMTGVMECRSERSEASERLRAGRSGRPCGDGLPTGEARRERNKSRNTGHSILHRCFVFIGAQSSGPSGGDCTLPRSPGLDIGRTACPRQGSGRSPCKKKRKRPVETDCPAASTRVVQYATLPGRGGVGCP